MRLAAALSALALCLIAGTAQAGELLFGKARAGDDLATVAALIWANVPALHASYESVSDYHLGPAALGLDLSIEHWAADGRGPRPYAAGTWGPSASSAMIARDGFCWSEEC